MKTDFRFELKGNDYIAPEVDMAEIAIECGFAASSDKEDADEIGYDDYEDWA